MTEIVWADSEGIEVLVWIFGGLKHCDYHSLIDNDLGFPWDKDPFFISILLPKKYFFSILDITIFDYNLPVWFYKALFVVICFQFWILRSLITTILPAFLICRCCDLLSILDITIFDYNCGFKAIHDHVVVICFQFWILRSLITTILVSSVLNLSLWFAFNSGYYDLWLQL